MSLTCRCSEENSAMNARGCAGYDPLIRHPNGILLQPARLA